MKGLRGAITMVLAACLMQACNNRKPQNYNLAVDTDGDTTPDTSVKLNMVVDKNDQQFAVTAINNGITEIELGRLAIKNGHSREVKNFGQMMVKDHSKSDHQLLLLMKSKDISMPASSDSSDKTLINNLAQKSGGDFDKAYISYMMDDHEKDVQLFTVESKKLQDPELKNFAIKTLPTLKNHLDEINAIHNSGVK
jgi:putative membrane protein